jgi:endonuclease/exonuclease/phosphatase (EEP) superfamily protein YafD
MRSALRWFGLEIADMLLWIALGVVFSVAAALLLVVSLRWTHHYFSEEDKWIWEWSFVALAFAIALPPTIWARRRIMRRVRDRAGETPDGGRI